MIRLSRARCSHAISAWLPLGLALAYVTLVPSLVPSLVPNAACPFRLFLDHECPTCGTTRAIRLLVAGQFAGALAMNPVAYVVAAVLTRHGILYSYHQNRSLAWLDSRPMEYVLLTLFFMADFLETRERLDEVEEFYCRSLRAKPTYIACWKRYVEFSFWRRRSTCVT